MRGIWILDLDCGKKQSTNLQGVFVQPFSTHKKHRFFWFESSRDVGISGLIFVRQSLPWMMAFPSSQDRVSSMK